MTTAGQGRWKLLIQSPSTNLKSGEQPHVGYSRFSSREKALKYAGERLAPTIRPFACMAQTVCQLMKTKSKTKLRNAALIGHPLRNTVICCVNSLESCSAG